MKRLVISDFRSRHMRSSLGSLWSVINSLVMIAIYTVIFPKIMGARLPGMTSGFAVFAAFALLSLVGGYFIFRSSVADIVNEI